MTVAELKKFLEENNVPDDLRIIVWNIRYGWTDLVRINVHDFSDGDKPVVEING